jgi:hypothetical protein
MKKTWAVVALCLFVSVIAAAAPGTIDTVPAAGTYVVNDDKVNVRAAPDAAAGKVVGKLNKGASVEVTEMSVLTYAVQKMRAAWYHIKSPDGWVYGYFLDPADSPTRTGPPPAPRDEH